MDNGYFALDNRDYVWQPDDNVNFNFDWRSGNTCISINRVEIVNNVQDVPGMRYRTINRTVFMGFIDELSPENIEAMMTDENNIKKYKTLKKQINTMKETLNRTITSFESALPPVAKLMIEVMDEE